MKEVKELVDKYSSKLEVKGMISTTEAEKRAGDFLHAMAVLTNYRHLFAEEKIKKLSTQTAVYAVELFKGTAKTMTENKVLAEAAHEYVKAREELEAVENDISYLKAYYDIFMAAHVFYRNLAKGEMM